MIDFLLGLAAGLVITEYPGVLRSLFFNKHQPRLLSVAKFPKLVLGTEVIRSDEHVCVSVVKLTDEAKRGLSTGGALITGRNGIGAALYECQD